MNRYRGVKKNRLWAKEMLAQPCFYCGEPATTIDHKVPHSRGGQTIKENCVPCCNTCNGQKGNLTTEEFILQRGLIGVSTAPATWKPFAALAEIL